jgi:hypothetical protein
VPGASFIEYAPLAMVAAENPFDGPPDASTNANCKGWPVSHAVIVPESVPCAGAAQVANLNLPIRVRQLNVRLFVV